LTGKGKKMVGFVVVGLGERGEMTSELGLRDEIGPDQ